MWKLLLGLGILLIALTVLPIVSYFCADTNGQITFVSDLTLNITAELVGVLITLSGVLLYAAFAARDRFDSMAGKFAELIAQLRCDGTLTPEAARRSMVVAVKLMTPENVTRKKTDANEPIGIANQICDVCALPTTSRKGKACDDCGVEDYVWSIEKKPIPLEGKCKPLL
jgi:hypothetical protein